MSTMNPFDLLGDDDNEDPSLLVVAQQHKLEKPKKAPAPAPAKAPPVKPAQLPTKPPPPAQSVRESRNESGREGGRGGRGGGRGGGGGGGRGGGRGFGRGRGDRDREFNRDSNANDFPNEFSGGHKPSEEEERPSERRGGYGGPRGPFRGGRRGGFSNGESGEGEGERPRRFYDRRSGTGRGNEFKRDGAGRGNWGTPADEVAPETEEPVVENEKNVDAEKQPAEEGAVDASKDNAVNEPEEKEPENKEMTLEEYEKVLEEKRKALLALRTEERKVDVDKAFKSMQQLSNKKINDEIFIKLGSEKEKRKDAADKEEKIKKSVSINEFLKPAEGGRYNNPSGRGRGRGRGSRGGYGGQNAGNVQAPKIEDAGEFPSLGGGK